jgi:hypothetical protein
MLRVARWLTTGQICRRFFPRATADAARKRLRKLVAARYLSRYRAHAMTETLFRLGPEGKQLLEERATDRVVVERRPPRQLEHFVGINDVRIAAELSGKLRYFFACWELPGLGWAHPVIPDAVFALDEQTFALEFDRGLESIRFFKRTKLPAYCQGFDGLPLTAILVVTDRAARMESMLQALGVDDRILFTTIGLVREHGFGAPIFQRQLGERVELAAGSLVGVS